MSDELKLGPELDALIAEKVMGIKGPHRCGCEKTPEGYSVHFYDAMDGRCLGCGAINRLKNYSTDIAPSWKVVEKMRELGFYPDLISTHSAGQFYWRCEMHTANDEKYPDNPFIELAETAPHAICLAALKAVQK